MKKIRKAIEAFGAITALAIIYSFARGPRLSEYERGYADGSMSVVKATIRANRERKHD